MAYYNNNEVSENMVFVTDVNDTASDILDELRPEYIRLAEYIEENIPNGRLRSLALTNLEQSLMWAVNATVHADEKDLT